MQLPQFLQQQEQLKEKFTKNQAEFEKKVGEYRQHQRIQMLEERVALLENTIKVLLQMQGQAQMANRPAQHSHDH